MLDTKQRKVAKYFVGHEVEHTICHGMKTLFVVGVPPLAEIIHYAKATECNHIYLGTSQSFTLENNTHGYDAWDDIIISLLKKDYWVTLDFDVRYIEQIQEAGYCEFSRFVPMISVKIPYINQLNYNATLKIDDKTWGATNTGVWSVPLNEFMQRKYYTHWDQYAQDTVIND